MDRGHLFHAIGHDGDGLDDATTTSGKAVPTPREWFLDDAPRLATVVFTALASALQLAATALCAFNALTAPIEWWQGPWGVYAVNAAAGVTNLIALSVWADLHNRKLSSNPAIAETLDGTATVDSANLGYSYWLMFSSLLLTGLSCVAIRFRNVLKKYVDTKEDVAEAPTNNVDSMLF